MGLHCRVSVVVEHVHNCAPPPRGRYRLVFSHDFGDLLAQNPIAVDPRGFLRVDSG